MILLKVVSDVLGTVLAWSFYVFITSLWFHPTVHPNARGPASILFGVILLVFIYETGYKKYFRVGRKKAFLLIFIAPAPFALVAISARLLWSFFNS